jgi:hypothetical protein
MIQITDRHRYVKLKNYYAYVLKMNLELQLRSNNYYRVFEKVDLFLKWKDCKGYDMKLNEIKGHIDQVWKIVVEGFWDVSTLSRYQYNLFSCDKVP